MDTVNQTLAGSPATTLTPPVQVAPIRSMGERLRRWLVVLVLAVQCVFPIWLSLNDHPLYAPDEGRYGSVSETMLRTGNWLVPMIDGHPHLTKPPLVYWLQAIALTAIGDAAVPEPHGRGEDELALRLPSVLAATLIVLITFGLGAKWGGARRGLIAAGLLSLMPLHVAVGRLAITDSVLSLFWTAALAAGFMAVDRGGDSTRRAWPWAGAMWLAVALGLLAKGPLALAPVAVLLIWLALTGRWTHARRLHLWGALLACLPVGVWAWQIVQSQPEALAVWRYEMLNRATGSGEHPEPFWFYLPIVICGLFPATATLSLPGIEYSWRAGWKCCRTPGMGSLMAMAVVAPLIGFTFMSGKLATYLLPLAPPLALLAAGVLEDRLMSARGDAQQAKKALQSIATVCISSAIVLVIMLVGVARLTLQVFWVAVLVSLLPLTALMIWRLWPLIRGDLQRSMAALALLWAAAATAWFGAFEFEDSLTTVYGTEQLIELVHEQPGLQDPLIATLGYDDPTLFRYVHDPAMALKNSQIEQWIDSLSTDDRRRAVLLAKEDIWRQIMARRPQVSDLFADVGKGTYRFNTSVIVLRLHQQ